MTNLLDELSKEDLIAVIANITYPMGYGDFRNHGLTDEEAGIAVKVGRACEKYCVRNGWDMPQV